MSVNWHGVGLAVTHANTLKNVSSVLALVKKEVIRPQLYGDAEEVMEMVEVLHHEMLLVS
jgi:hypothetical protein